MKKSIRRYYTMLCILLGLSISGILVLSYQAHNQAVSLLKKQFHDQQMLVAVQTAHGIEANIQSLVWQLEALTRMPGITEMDTEQARKSMGLVFDHVKEMVVNDIALVDSRGIVILPLLARDFAGTNVSYREYFRQARNMRKQAPVYEYITFQGIEKGKKGIVIAMPFFDMNGKFNGLVLFTIKADELIRRFIPLQNGGTEYCVLDSSGHILYHPVYKPGANISEGSNMHSSFRDFTNKIKDGKAYQGEYMSEDGLRYIASACPSNIVGRKWMIMAAAPEKTIRGLLAKFNADYLFAMILLALTLAGGAGLTLKSQHKWNRSLQQEIRERKKIEEEREHLIDELKTNLERVKLLSGLLPICASCKKIRDDKGYWNQIEAYIRDHSEADFSHGICPECAIRLYPDFYRER